MKTFLSLACVAVVFALAGCSGDTTRGIVKGSVTYQGEPVPEGQIIFRLADNSAVEGAIIKDGEFESSAPIGECFVQITARKKVGVKNPSSAQEENPFATVAYIPAKYNDKSTLQLSVESGTQEHDFHLE